MDVLPPQPPQAEPAGQWPKPTPLPSRLPSVPEFSPRLLPTDIRAWVVDIAERMQCPLDFVGIAAMVGLGAVIGRRIGIRPETKTTWTETGNLWGCIVGYPGVMKSPAITEALAPIRKLEAEADAKNQEVLEQYRKDLARFNLQMDAARAQARKKVQKQEIAIADMEIEDLREPQAPAERRLLVTDGTVEKLGTICMDNPMGILVHRDELLTLLQDLDRSEKAAARGFLLTGWNGQDGYTFDRIKRGTIRVPSVNLSLIGTTQPNRLGDYLKDSLRKHDDGMVQRLQLLTFPDQSPEWRHCDRYPDAEARSRAFECFEDLATLNPFELGAERDPFDDGDGVPFLRFTPHGAAQFLEWRSYLEERLRGEDLPSYFVSHLAKYRGLVPRLALITHLASGGHGPVTQEACVNGIAWAEYLEEHAKRAYALMNRDRFDVATLILQKISAGDLADGFTERDIYRPQWSGLTDREAIKSALRLLEEYDWVRSERQMGAGRPTVIWKVNPLASLA